MIDAMQVRGFSVRTHETYLSAVSALAKHYHRSPEHIQIDELRDYFVYLVKERGLSAASCRLSLNAIRFLYLEVLQWSAFDVPFPVPKQPQKIPELLTRAEVARILAAPENLKHRALLMTCYGCGLRVSELVAIQISHIDSERRLLRIEQGKGAKDRYVVIADTLLTHLRRYWQQHRPALWLFPGYRPNQPLTVTTPQKVFRAAKRQAGVHKHGGIHSLRHAYATHQMEAGLPVHQLQRLLGHRHIQATLRYVHWLPQQHGTQPHADLLANLERPDGQRH
jgi:site-specific recombinase XerD